MSGPELSYCIMWRNTGKAVLVFLVFSMIFAFGSLRLHIFVFFKSHIFNLATDRFGNQFARQTIINCSDINDVSCDPVIPLDLEPHTWEILETKLSFVRKGLLILFSSGGMLSAPVSLEWLILLNTFKYF